MDASGLKGRCPLPLINGRSNKGYMILAGSTLLSVKKGS